MLGAARACQLFVSYLARWLCTRRLVSPLFHPPEPQIIGRQNVLPLCYLFAHLNLLFFDSSLIFFFSCPLVSSSRFFSSLTLSTSASSWVHIVGNLTSKLLSKTANGLYILSLVDLAHALPLQVSSHSEPTARCAVLRLVMAKGNGKTTKTQSTHTQPAETEGVPWCIWMSNPARFQVVLGPGHCLVPD